MLGFYRKIKKIKPKYFYGYPSAIYEFSKFLKSKSIDAGSFDIKAVIVTGETLYDFQRKFIEDVFKAKVVNEYGCSEAGIIAFQCPRGRMHLSEDNLFIEILCEGRPAEPGETGEVVITEIYNYSTPLIRYRVGDLARVSFNPLCDCGRGLSCIDSVEGRTSQFITLANGRKVHTELFSYIGDELAGADGVLKQFRIIQHRDLKFTVEYVSGSGKIEETLSYLSAQIKKFLGQGLELNFKQVESIPRDKNGKLRYFISS